MAHQIFILEAHLNNTPKINSVVNTLARGVKRSLNLPPAMPAAALSAGDAEDGPFLGDGAVVEESMGWARDAERIREAETALERLEANVKRKRELQHNATSRVRNQGGSRVSDVQTASSSVGVISRMKALHVLSLRSISLARRIRDRRKNCSP